MSKLMALMALLALGLPGLMARAETTRQVRFTIQTLPGNLASSRKLLPKKTLQPGEAQSLFLSAGTKLPKDPKAGLDVVGVSTPNKVSTSIRENSKPPITNELRMLPILNTDASITVSVDYLRWKGSKIVTQTAPMKTRLRKGEKLLVAPAGSDVYAISVEEITIPVPAKTQKPL